MAPRSPLRCSTLPVSRRASALSTSGCGPGALTAALAERDRARELLAGAGVSGLFGPGQYPFFSHSDDGQITYWLCFYIGTDTEINFNLAQDGHRQLT